MGQHPGDRLIPPTTVALAEAALAAGEKSWSAELFASLTREGAPQEYVARGLSGVAWSQFEAGQLAEAAESCRQLLTRFPQDELAAETALARRTDSPAADEAGRIIGRISADYRKIRRQPQLSAALLGAARLCEQLQQDAEAAALYERLDRDFPELPEHETVIYEWAWVLTRAE